MSAPRRRHASPATPRTPHHRRGAAAVLLLLLGLVLAALARVSAGSERHAYSASAVPPASSQLTAGKTYRLSVPGGVSVLQDHDLNPAALRCEWSEAGGGPVGSSSQPLTVSLYGQDSKATDAIGSFVAPVTGAVHVDCDGWGAMFVDDADDAGFDTSGLLVVLCVIAFTLGVPLGLSALRAARAAGGGGESARAAREDEEVQRLVDVVRLRSQDGEVAAADRGDVGA